MAVSLILLRRGRPLYHSITIGNDSVSKNTWNDWHLIPESRPLFNPPSVKFNYVDIPGADGSLDLTTVMTGKPLYENRTGSWTFIAENGYREWQKLYSDISVYLHGRKFRATLEDDPEFYYEGRFSVNQWRSDPYWSKIVIDYNVDPYKHYTLGEDKWLWDTFCFLTDSIRHYRDLVVMGSLDVSVKGDVMDAIPVFISSVDGLVLTYGSIVRRLPLGASQYDDIVVHEGENPMHFDGYGTISIRIEGGRL